MRSRSIADFANSCGCTVLERAARQPAIIAPIAARSCLAEGGHQRQVDRLVVAVVEVRAGAAERREARGPGRHEHLGVADALGVAGDVQRAAAAVAEQRVVGRRVALAEDLSDGLVLERLLEQLDHAGGRRLHAASPSGRASCCCTAARARSMSSCTSPPRK